MSTPSETKADLETLRRLLPYLWQPERSLRARVVLALTFLVLAKIASVIVPLFYKHAVDALSLSPSQGLLVVPLVAIFGYGLSRVLSQALGDLRDAVFTKVLQRAIRKLALEVFNHLHALALRFHLERQTGGLSRIIERGTKSIETLMSFLLFNTLPVLLELAFTLCILIYFFDWRFAAITLATIGLYIYYTIAVTEWRLKIRREMNEQDTKANTKAIDSLLNYETVKYFNNEKHEAMRYDGALQAYEKSAVLSRTSLALLNIGQAFIIQAGLVAVMVLAAQGVAAGTLTVGDFVLVNTYLIQLAMPLFIFGTAYREIKQGLVDMEKMFALLSVNREIADAPDAKQLVVSQGRVEFDNVTFAYDSRRPILKGISFVAEPGQTVAVVGSSGAGKSTLSRLLFRFYDIQGGAIKIDGQDIRSVTQASLRGALGIVPQDTVLFNDTIAYNIGYGKPNATQADIEAAARMAQIHDFCTKLPDGYNTIVGERGLKLSGGEKQRVAIARTILKNPPLLVFDEATSALDTHTEKDIQASLRDVSKGRTTLMIAHRLSTVAEANLILVLADGQIAERGSHSELLSKNGLYAALWKRQLEAESAALT